MIADIAFALPALMCWTQFRFDSIGTIHISPRERLGNIKKKKKGGRTEWHCLDHVPTNYVKRGRKAEGLQHPPCVDNRLKQQAKQTAFFPHRNTRVDAIAKSVLRFFAIFSDIFCMRFPIPLPRLVGQHPLKVQKKAEKVQKRLANSKWPSALLASITPRNTTRRRSCCYTL